MVHMRRDKTRLLPAVEKAEAAAEPGGV